MLLYFFYPLAGSPICFRFESSSHAISMSAYLREQRRELYSKSGELQGEHGGWREGGLKRGKDLGMRCRGGEVKDI